eukprot:2562536-Pyramimonas_sp.AAC.1
MAAVTFLVFMPLYVTQHVAGHNNNCHAEILAVATTLASGERSPRLRSMLLSQPSDWFGPRGYGL